MPGPEPLTGFGEAPAGVFLAGASLPDSGAVAVAAAFSADAARRRAEALAAAIDALHRLPDRPAGPPEGDGAELRLGDFMPDPPAPSGALLAGMGLLSGASYLLPAEVVRLGEHESGVEPTLVGIVRDRPREGVADVLAHDVFTRWWEQPRTPLLRVSARLPDLLPGGVAEALSGLGLWLSAFLVPGPGFALAVVGLGGEGATIATAGARSVRSAVTEAFLRAVAARAQPWSALPVADSLRRLTVWHRKADYLGHLERSARDGAAAAADGAPPWEESGWADLAVRRFGHEPVLVADPLGRPVKVVCPGAACYRPAPPGTPLPCPVP